MSNRKGPGKSHRKGLSLVQIVRKFDTEQKAEDWFIKQRWPHGVTCPFCQSQAVSPRPTRKPQPFRCRTCRKDFSVKTGTVLHSSNIPLSKWAIGFYLFMTNLKGVSSMKLHRDLGIGQKAAWYMAHRIQETLDVTSGRFAGPVEVDEPFIGGKETNKHENKKLKLGRGTAGKTAVAGVKDRETNQVRTEVVKGTDTATLKDFVLRHTKPSAVVYTDQAAAYRNLPRTHEFVNHGTKEYVRGVAHTNGIESPWALFKRGLDGIYHHVSVKHLQRYNVEFQGRHNWRPLDTVDQIARMAQGIGTKRLTYAALIGA